MVFIMKRQGLDESHYPHTILLLVVNPGISCYWVVSSDIACVVYPSRNRPLKTTLEEKSISLMRSGLNRNRSLVSQEPNTQSIWPGALHLKQRETDLN